MADFFVAGKLYANGSLVRIPVYYDNGNNLVLSDNRGFLELEEWFIFISCEETIFFHQENEPWYICKIITKNGLLAWFYTLTRDVQKQFIVIDTNS